MPAKKTAKGTAQKGPSTSRAATKSKKLSAIAAAAKVLAESKTAMTTREVIEAMSSQGLWTSPSGKTPHATLYSAILREIGTKGKDSRFTKSGRGKFAVKS